MFALSPVLSLSSLRPSFRRPHGGALDRPAGDATYYNVGFGACGLNNVVSDPIAAISHGLFDSYPGYTGGSPYNPICGKWGTATKNGRSVRFQVEDRCGGCAGFGELEFSRGAYPTLTRSTPAAFLVSAGPLDGSCDSAPPGGTSPVDCATTYTAVSGYICNDVLVCALELLPDLVQLRLAAGVSRQFYAAAWRAGLYFHFENSATLDQWNGEAVEHEADTWNELVDHALRKDLRVAFTIVGARSGSICSPTSLPLLGKLLAPVTRSLPILVSLSITIGGFAYPDLRGALQGPAPRLRSLTIRSGPYSDDPIGPISPTCGLFSGIAPLLRELGLDSRSLGRTPVPVFANIVRFATWVDDSGHRVSLSRHFPGLMHLMVSCGSDGEEDQFPIPPPQLGLAGLTLRSLAFRDTTPKSAPPVERALAIPGSSFAVFHCVMEDESRIMAGDEPLGWRDDSIIAMHVRENRGLQQNVRVAPFDGHWRRSYIIRRPVERAALYGRAALAAQVGYLRIGHAALRDLVQCPAQFGALRRLRVDIIIRDWDGFWYQSGPLCVELLDADLGHGTVQCPVLESLCLLWRTRAPEQPVVLDAKSVVIIGRALRTDARPTLELGDVEYGRPLALSDESAEDRAAVLDVFSAVRRVATVLDQFDGDEWNDNVALEVDRYLGQSLAW